MQENDLASIQALSGQLGYAATGEELAKRFQQLQALRPTLFVYLESGAVMGFIHLEKTHGLVEADRVTIKALVVDQEFRLEGIGKALIQFSKEWGKTYGLDTISLSCNILSEEAHAFYKREGFNLKKSSHIFEMKF